MRKSVLKLEGVIPEI